MLSYLLALWREPRVADPPGRQWFDWLVPGLFIPIAVIEALVNPEFEWPVVSLLVGSAIFLGTLFRRRQPLLVLIGTLALMAVVETASEIQGVEWGLYAMAIILVLPYALGRWAAGWEIEVGVVAMAVYYTFISIVDWVAVGDAVAGGVIFFFPVVLGIAIRYQRHNRLRALDEVRLRERETLARELHDTVAHHVSAIAIQAQAGRAVAANRPEAALEALEVVENEASRTLAEMRTMIGALRQGDETELTPQRGVADIGLLVDDGPTSNGHRPEVEVDLRGELDGLRPSVDAALYRLAQESITNAIRHARRASRIEVRVVGGPDYVVLTVVDDGDISAIGPVTDGYGLVGMAERAKLLGGTFTAGPTVGQGWRVEATLPRSGIRS